MGPERTSSRERFGLGAAAARADCFRDTAFFDDCFFDAAFWAGLPAAAFFFDAFFGTDFLTFLLATLRDDFFAGFLLRALAPAFLATFFFAGLRAAVLRRAADFFFDTFLVEGFFLVLLTLRFFPEDFLPALAVREDARARVVAVRFRFLLAAFLAGMIDSCRSEKNAELYIG